MLGCATFGTLIPVRVLAVAAFVGLVAVVWAIIRWRAPSAAQHRATRLASDSGQPLKAWAQGAFLVVTGDLDYGHLPPAQARQMLIHWWETHGPHELLSTLDGLENPDRPDNAWDLLRFIVVARLATAANYLSDDEAWRSIYPVARRLQASYRSWPDMTQAYVVARRQWKGAATDGSEDDGGMRRILDNIANLREGLWERVSWSMPFEPPEPEQQS
ncbi:MAG: DUF1266 domain-containing protein [Nannocystaceae bacterium]|nr:DUF1266 domain-containing protein [Nannocystaceae bacterium]